jgi:hypothetical protein
MMQSPILGYCAKCDQPADSTSCAFDDFTREWVVTIQHHGESATIRVPAGRETTRDPRTVTAFDKKAA